jgi:threonine dehydrogenase-like Zn-dependent dehydrogenase
MSSAKKLPYSDGAFSEYIVRPEGSVFVMPDSMAYDHAAVLEPISVGYHAVQRSGIKAGQRAAILGCGPIAGCVLLVLRAIGIGSIIMMMSKNRG